MPPVSAFPKVIFVRKQPAPEAPKVVELLLDTQISPTDREKLVPEALFLITNSFILPVGREDVMLPTVSEELFSKS